MEPKLTRSFTAEGYAASSGCILIGNCPSMLPSFDASFRQKEEGYKARAILMNSYL